MKNKKIVLTGFSLLAALGLMTAVPAAHASISDTSIINSGNDVEVDAETEKSTEIEVENKNFADVTQHVDATAKTGGNNADRNIALDSDAGAAIQTGNAAVQVGLDVDANRNTTAIAGFGQNGDSFFLDLVNTGNDVDVDASTENETEIEVENKNFADVHQNVDAHTATGHNNADRNVGGAQIMSGDAAVSVGLDADLNSNETFMGLGDSEMDNGDVQFSSIVNTGNDLEVDSEGENETEVSFESQNTLFTHQMMRSRTQTGENNADRNVGSSWINSGNAGTQTGADVSGNHNMSFFGNMFDMIFGWMS